MENSFQTSFIPKKPINSAAVTTVKPGASLFSIISIIILVIVGAGAGGLYVYKNYLIKQKEVLSDTLAKVRDSFEKDTITELELFDKRVSAAKQVLTNHLVLSPMFTLLGKLTIPSIQYTKFNHETTDKGFNVKMSGIAKDYRSIALQADVFNSANTAKSRSFKNVVFSNLTKDKNGFVDFDIEFTVDPTLLSYEKNMILEQAQAKAEAAAGNTGNTVVPGQTQGTTLPADSTTQDNSELPVSNQSTTGTTGATTPAAPTTNPKTQ